MKYINISIGNIIISIESQIQFIITTNIKKYCVINKNPDVYIVIKDWKEVERPKSSSCGEDDLMMFYCDDNFNYCEAKSGKLEPIVSTCYKQDFSRVVTSINTNLFPNPKIELEFLFQLFPLRELFGYFECNILHSSQILVEDRGILFCGPSGIGKTTQANLWKKCINAKILCNDRTLLRKFNGKWYTYGLPMDGSDPICSNEATKLGTIIVLGQGNKNVIRRLSPSKAIIELMKQTIFDCWNNNEKFKIQLRWLDIIEQIPIYFFSCVPNESAVNCMLDELKKDGVLK